MTKYIPNPEQRSWYTPDNFNFTYHDFISSAVHKKWSVGPSRRKMCIKRDFEKRFRLLLSEVDKANISWVPGTEDDVNPIPFPRNEMVRDDHEFKWHRSVIEIVGPWCWGWSPVNPEKVRESGPTRYGDYTPWLLNFSGFNFDYSEEEQYDMSSRVKAAKKPKTSRMFYCRISSGIFGC